MFRLHERTQRRMAWMLFLLLGIAPTVAMLAWAVAWRLPGHAQAEAQRLGWLLGMKVSVHGVRHLTPGTMVYDGLELANPETGRILFRCRSLETAWQTLKDEQGQSRTFLVLTAAQSEVETVEAEELRQLVDRALNGRIGWPEACVWLRAGDLLVQSASGPQPLSEVQAKLETTAQGAWAGLAFCLPGAGMQDLAVIRVSRKRQPDASLLAFDLDTAGAALPCTLWGVAPEGLAALGTQARFRGLLSADLAADGWSGRIKQAQFDGVDLGELVRRLSHHALRGNARLTVDTAEFRDSRLVQARGVLEVTGGGQISPSLLAAAVQRLKMRPRPLPTSDEMVAFDQLALGFSIDGQQLQLQGRCPLNGVVGTAVLTDREGPLVDSPGWQPLSVIALVQALAPPSEQQVPATAHTDWLLRSLAVVEPTAPRESPSDERIASRDRAEK